MRRVEPRLAKLAARASVGCAGCRRWSGTVLVDDAGTEPRPERCPGCGRGVPIRTAVHVIGVSLDLL